MLLALSSLTVTISRNPLYCFACWVIVLLLINNTGLEYRNQCRPESQWTYWPSLFSCCGYGSTLCRHTGKVLTHKCVLMTFWLSKSEVVYFACRMGLYWHGDIVLPPTALNQRHHWLAIHLVLLPYMLGPIGSIPGQWTNLLKSVLVLKASIVFCLS